MLSRVAATTVIAAVVASIAFAGIARAADKTPAEKTHSGKVVSVTEMKSIKKDGKVIVQDAKLVMSDLDGKKEHSHTVFAKTKITLNKKDAKLADLKKGDMVTVTTDAADKVTAIAATREAK